MRKKKEAQEIKFPKLPKSIKDFLLNILAGVIAAWIFEKLKALF